MLIEEFLVALGVEADTKKVEGFSSALAKVGTIATVVVGAIKATTMAVWAFADSYIRRADELSKANSNLYTITKEQVEMSKKYEEGMGKLGKIIESVKVRVAFGFLPTMLEMVNTFNNFLDANKDLITNGILKLLDAISKVSQVINNTVRFIVKIIEATIGWKGALIGLVAIFALVKRAMILAFITNPITWIVAAIVGLMLLIDDFMTYLDGGESQFGEFWGAMLSWIEKIKPALQSVWDALVTGMSYLIEFGAYVAKYFGGALVDAVELITAVLALLVGIFTGDTELMKEAWSGLIENLVSMFRNFAMLFEPLAKLIAQIMAKVWDSIVNYVSSKITQLINAVKGFVSSIGDALSNVFDIVTAPFARAFDWISDKFSGIGNFISGAVSGAKSLVSGGASSATSNTVNNGGNVTINAPISVSSNDPVRAGQASQDGMKNLMNMAHRNMGSGVKL